VTTIPGVSAIDASVRTPPLRTLIDGMSTEPVLDHRTRVGASRRLCEFGPGEEHVLMREPEVDV